MFDCGVRVDGSARVELQRIDCPEDHEPLFPDDQSAWQHVVSRARAGSPLHLEALSRIDEIERFLVEAHCGAWPS